MQRWMLCLLFLPTVANAQYLYTCRDYSGNTTIQDSPCPPTQREVRRVAKDAHVPTRAEQESRQRVIDEAKAFNDAGIYGLTTSDTRKPWDPPAGTRWSCDAATRRRDAYIKSIGLARNYEVLSGWQGAVYEACKNVRPGTSGF